MPRDTFASLKKTCRRLGVNLGGISRIAYEARGAPAAGPFDPPEGGGGRGQESPSRAAA